MKQRGRNALKALWSKGLSVLNLASERVVNFGLQGVTSHDEEWESEISDGEGLLSGI